jgi:hypothetical protein
LLPDDRDADGGQHALDHGRRHQRGEPSRAQHAKERLEAAGHDDRAQERLQTAELLHLDEDDGCKAGSRTRDRERRAADDRHDEAAHHAGDES